MATKRRWQRLFAFGVLFVLLFAACVADWVYGLSPKSHTNLTFEQYTARYDRLAIPSTASDISLYAHGARGEEQVIMITFTVPDEKTFVDWARSEWEKCPSGFSEYWVVHFEGNHMARGRGGDHFGAGKCARVLKYYTTTVYDKNTNRVCIHRIRDDGGD